MRLGVFSNQNMNPWINWSTLGPPLLEPLSAHEGAQLIAPPPLALTSASLKAWAHAMAQVLRADTLFWMQGSVRPETAIHLAAMMRGPVRRSAFVVDAWAYLLPKIGMLASAQRLNPCFVAMREGCEELARRHPRARFEWLPFGVDTEVFDRDEGERTVFAYWMGRRFDSLHNALVSYCASRGLEYRYTQRSGEFADPKELGRLIGRSKYFVVNPPELSDPSRTGGFSPFVMRYLEGLSAGARLLGTLPRSGEYERLLPRDAILLVAPDGSDLAAKLDADRENPAGWEAVERARLLVREQHSWARRAEQIYQRLNAGVPTGYERA